MLKIMIFWIIVMPIILMILYWVYQDKIDGMSMSESEKDHTIHHTTD